LNNVKRLLEGNQRRKYVLRTIVTNMNAILAEGVRFELTDASRHRRFSRPVH
jgi:hypothetical protein